MRNRWIVAALAASLLAPCFASAGERTEVFVYPPPGVIYMDDLITVKIDRSYRTKYEHSVTMESSGFRIQHKDQWTENDYLLYPTMTGPVTLGPFRFTDSKGRVTESTQKFHFTVREAADDFNSSTDEALRGLVAAKRPPITIRPSSDWVRGYLGQPITITWQATYLPFNELASFGSPTLPKIEGLQILPESVQGFSRPSMNLGGGPEHVEIAHWTVIPSETGTYQLDPGWVMGQLNNWNGTSVQFHRRAPSVRIDVLELPHNIDPELSIGEFTLACPERVWVSSGSVEASVEVKGNGLIRRKIGLGEGETRPIAIIWNGFPNAKVSGSGVESKAHATFSLLSHGRRNRDVNLPEIVFEFWNPRTGALEAARCEAKRFPIEWPQEKRDSKDTEAPAAEPVERTTEEILDTSASLPFEALALVVLALGIWGIRLSSR